MRIVMQSQAAKIGMQTQNAKLNMHTEQAAIEISTEPGNINAQSTPKRITIDQSQCFSESGLKGILELSAENSQNAVQEMYASIGRIVDQGNQLADVRSGGSIIAEQAYYNAYDQFDKEFNMVTMPKSRPVINFEGGEVSFNPTPTKISITPRLSPPEMEYQPGKVDIYLKQQNQLNISVEGQKFDQQG